MNIQWKSLKESYCPEGVFVYTKIDDANGCRNIQKLKRQGNLWFGTDDLYVYYTPTHWGY